MEQGIIGGRSFVAIVPNEKRRQSHRPARDKRRIYQELHNLLQSPRSRLVARFRLRRNPDAITGLGELGSPGEKNSAIPPSRSCGNYRCTIPLVHHRAASDWVPPFPLLQIAHALVKWSLNNRTSP